MRSTRGLDIGTAEALIVTVSEPEQGYDSAGALDMLLPAAVLLDLADSGHLEIGGGRAARTGVGADGGREYERLALELGSRLDGDLPGVLWAVTDGLRPLARTVAAELIAEGRVDSVKNKLLKMSFGDRFPALDVDFHDAVRSRVQSSLETGDPAPPFGGVAMLLAAGHLARQVFPGVDTAPMDRVAAGDTPVSGAGFQDAAVVVVLQQLTTTIQQTTLR